MTLHYERLGRGPHILLAFHGAGQTGHECFRPFANRLGDYYTIYAFDLFFHGKSPGMNSDAPFTAKDVVTKQKWVQCMQAFLSNHSITRFDVVGFSLGGRFALATAEAFAEFIDRLFLIAPDGISEHPLYHVATRFPPGRWLYRQLTVHPRPLFLAITLIEKGRLLPTRTVRFVRHMLETSRQRQQIYQSWVSFRTLSFAIVPLYIHLLSHGVSLWLLAGRHDPMLPPARFRILSDLIPQNRFVILESGHTRLVEKAAAYLSGLLK